MLLEYFLCTCIMGFDQCEKKFQFNMSISPMFIVDLKHLCHHQLHHSLHLQSLHLQYSNYIMVQCAFIITYFNLLTARVILLVRLTVTFQQVLANTV